MIGCLLGVRSDSEVLRGDDPQWRALGISTWDIIAAAHVCIERVVFLRRVRRFPGPCLLSSVSVVRDVRRCW